MIISQTDDVIWQNRFAHLPPFEPPAGPLLVLAPHPDDETLGAGALIATLRWRGTPVEIVAATDGENAYEIGLDERRSLGKVREREQQQALAELGVNHAAIHRLRLTDSGLTAVERELTERLLALAQRGMTLLAPWTGDFHPDHEACARAATAVANAKGLPLIFYFFWTWHRGTPALLDGLGLRRFVASPDALAAKSRALARHRSQLDWPDGEPILPGRLLGPAYWPFEVFLPA